MIHWFLRRFSVAFVLSFLLTSGVQAQVCNGLNRSVVVALGVESRDQVATLGWINLSPSECYQNLEGLAAAEGIEWARIHTLWFHARDRVEEPRQSWEGPLDLCIDDLFDSFFADYADSTCEKRGYVHGGFEGFQMRALGQQGGVTLGPQGFRL